LALWSTGSSSDYRNDRERPYNGQSWTVEGVRGSTEVKGVTFRDIHDCFIKAFLLSSGEGKYYDRAENGTWRPQDIYEIDLNDIDPIAVSQNLGIEIEKMMGIYPNVPQIEFNQP